MFNRNIYFRDNSVRFDEVLFIFPGKLQTLVHNYNIPSKNWDKRRHVFLLIGVMLTNSNKKYANNPLIKKLHFYMIHGKQLFVAVVCMKYTINVSVRQTILVIKISAHIRCVIIYRKYCCYFHLFFWGNESIR